MLKAPLSRDAGLLALLSAKLPSSPPSRPDDCNCRAMLSTTVWSNVDGLVTMVVVIACCCCNGEGNDEDNGACKTVMLSAVLGVWLLLIVEVCVVCCSGERAVGEDGLVVK